jgi:hypothetical protein
LRTGRVGCSFGLPGTGDRAFVVIKLTIIMESRARLRRKGSSLRPEGSSLHL